MVQDFSQANLFYTERLEQAKMELDKLLQSVDYFEVDDKGKAIETEYVPYSKWVQATFLWQEIREEEQEINKYGVSSMALYGKYLQGNAKGYAPTLGFMADLFLTNIPESLNTTDRYILTGELVALTGKLEQLRGAGQAKVWFETWADMDKKDKRNEVRGWLKSYYKFTRKYLLKIKEMHI